MENSKANEAAAEPPLDCRVREERTLRYLLFIGHQHNGNSACLYGDDGEMQCGQCGCDFVRDSADELKRKMERWGMQECIRLGLVTVTHNLLGEATTEAAKPL